MTALPSMPFVARIHQQATTLCQSLEQRPDIGWFLHGHLMVEYQLKQRLQAHGKITRLILDKLGFFTLVTMCHDKHIIDADKKTVLLDLNALKNKFCCNLQYVPSAQEWEDLWSAACEAFPSVCSNQELHALEPASPPQFTQAQRSQMHALFIQMSQDL